jgi:hypothetical protein
LRRVGSGLEIGEQGIPTHVITVAVTGPPGGPASTGSENAFPIGPLERVDPTTDTVHRYPK